MIVGVIRRKPVLTYASIVCDMLASVNSVKKLSAVGQITKISSTLVYYGCSVHAFEAVNRLCVESRADYIPR